MTLMLDTFDQDKIDAKLREETISIGFSDSISDDELINSLKYIYDYENTLEILPTICINLRGLSVDKLSKAFQYALKREDLKDPLMILNILNLIKGNIKLNDEFFNDEYNFITNIVNMLNLKLSIKNDLEEFIKTLSIHFIALFKSYNKLSFTPLDKHIKLPTVYRNIILSTDILTLSGIFSMSKSFDTDECVYIDDAFYILSQLLMKSSIGISLMSDFLRNDDDNREE